MNDLQRLKKDYRWIQTPLVVGAPMRLIALADMAVEISKAGKSTSSPLPSHARSTCITRNHTTTYTHQHINTFDRYNETDSP
jgi:hypothetical protein